MYLSVTFVPPLCSYALSYETYWPAICVGQVVYEAESLNVALGAAYMGDSTRTGFSVSWTDEQLSVQAQLGLTIAAELSHTASASVAYALTANSRLQLAHTSATASNRTRLTYAHEFFLDPAVVGLSAGASYAWESGRFGLIAGASYQQGALTAG